MYIVFFNTDEAMLRLTNAALRNHHSLQFPLITDDVISLKEELPNGSVPNVKKKYCCKTS